jgi:hypothetical protein
MVIYSTSMEFLRVRHTRGSLPLRSGILGSEMREEQDEIEEMECLS